MSPTEKCDQSAVPVPDDARANEKDASGLVPRGDRCQDINANEKRFGAQGEGGAAPGGGKTQAAPQAPEGGEMVPPDGGWGWMVAVGTFMITTLVPMLGPCFGVLFSQYLLLEGSSSTTTAWIFNLQCFLWNASGLVTRPLVQEFGWRRVGVTSTLLTCVGLMLSAFTPCPEFLFFSFSLLTGLGGGAATCQCFTILPLYFARRRGIANAMMMSGICMGQFVGPPVARFLQDNYGFRGATLIISALMLHSILGASFFHPVEWHLKRAPTEGDSSKGKEGEAPLVPEPSHCLPRKTSEASFTGKAGEGELDPAVVVRARLLGRKDPRRMSGASFASSYNSTLSLASSDAVGIASLHGLDKAEKEEEKEEEEEEESGCGSSPLCGFLRRVARNTLHDLRVLRSLKACIICLGSMLCINGYLNFLMLMPFAMTAAGHSLDTAAWCISVSAVCNMLTRVLVSSLSDFPRFNLRLVYMLGAFTIGSSILVFSQLESPVWSAVVMAVCGCGIGANMGLYNLVMINVMGVDRLASVFGASCFVVSIGFIALGPFIGFIRDATQSYNASMYVTVAMNFLTFTLWLFMDVAARIDMRRDQNKKPKGELREKV